MLKEQLSLGLAIWGAVVSTFLAILRIVELRSKNMESVLIFAEVTFNSSDINFEVINISEKPVSIRKVEFYYGTSAGYGQLVLSSVINDPIKIVPGERSAFSYSRDELVLAARDANIVQDYHNLLWLTLESLTRRRFHEQIPVPTSLVESDSVENAKRFIATDIFLGFPPLNPRHNEPIHQK